MYFLRIFGLKIAIEFFVSVVFFKLSVGKYLTMQNLSEYMS